MIVTEADMLKVDIRIPNEVVRKAAERMTTRMGAELVRLEKEERK